MNRPVQVRNGVLDARIGVEILRLLSLAVTLRCVSFPEATISVVAQNLDHRPHVAIFAGHLVGLKPCIGIL